MFKNFQSAPVNSTLFQSGMLHPPPRHSRPVMAAE
jgi:hypothetical protein